MTRGRKERCTTPRGSFPWDGKKVRDGGVFAYGGGHGFLCLAAWLGDKSKGVERDPMDRGGWYVFHGA